MMEAMRRNWNTRKLASISLALSLLQLGLLFCCSAAIVTSGGSHIPLSLTDRIINLVWLASGLFSFCFAFAGLILDSRRLLAVFVLIFSVAVWLFCLLQLAIAD
jgi:hypothetical protein